MQDPPQAPSSSGLVLDVPGHAEATIRLHKVRVRTLEEDLSKLTKTLNGMCVVVVVGVNIFSQHMTRYFIFVNIPEIC